MPQLHLQQLQHLVEVARSPTWTEAARRLHLSQSALSQSLAEMERRLSVRLFERAGRRRPLTPEGEQLLRFAQRTLAEARELGARLAAGSGSGRLRIGMIDAVSLYVLPQVLRRHRRDHPQLDLSLRVAHSRELLRALEEFELDVAIVVGPIEQTNLVGQLLIEEPLYMYSPRGERGPAGSADWALYPAKPGSAAADGQPGLLLVGAAAGGGRSRPRAAAARSQRGDHAFVAPGDAPLQSRRSARRGVSRGSAPARSASRLRPALPSRTPAATVRGCRRIPTVF
jgi:DNA-binding transcriptional LysR family regulator